MILLKVAMDFSCEIEVDFEVVEKKCVKQWRKSINITAVHLCIMESDSEWIREKR